MTRPATIPPGHNTVGSGAAVSEFAPIVSGLAWSLTVQGDLLHDAGEGLRRIDTPEGWSGAAADQFRAVYLGLPRQWLQAGDCFHAAADALRRYAETVAWAQAQADAARQQWFAAEHASQAAAEQYRQAAAAGPVAPFVDPGAAGMAAAHATLERLGLQVAAAGDDAAAVVERARDQAPRVPVLPGVGGGLVGAAWFAAAEGFTDLKLVDNELTSPPTPVGEAGLTAVIAARNAVGTTRTLIDDARGVPRLGPAWNPVLTPKPYAANIHVSDADRSSVVSGGRWPRSWAEDQIVDVLEDVAQNPDRPPQPADGGTYRATGTRDGMRVTVVVDRSGRITGGSTSP